MKIRPTKGLTFEDVLLVPKKSSIRSRNDVSTSTMLTKEIPLNIPIISANMDTVTESTMAIALARQGGIGIIHRFMTIESQVEQVKRVKHSEGFMVENPYSIAQSDSVARARNLMQVYDIGGLAVKNKKKELIGLVTQRDTLLAPDEKATVGSVMTMPDDIITAGPDITPEKAHELLHQERLEKLPIVDAKGQLIGLITAQDVIRHQHFPNATKNDKGRLRVGGAIGILPEEIERAIALLEAGVDVLVIDIAHGHADHCIDMVKQLRKQFPGVQIIAGNVASGEGAIDLAKAGASSVKVGIGPGSICTTRIVTGFGVPQLTAIMDCVEGLAKAGFKIPVIADGGIQTSGDLVKALAAGASNVMIGSLFAGCDEAPGSTVIRDGRKFKVIRGMASLGATIDRRSSQRDGEKATNQEDWDKVVPEGVEAVVPYRGHVQEILNQLVGGLRSGLSYGGAYTIQELQDKAEFIEVTPAGKRESSYHDVNKI